MWHLCRPGKLSARVQWLPQDSCELRSVLKLTSWNNTSLQLIENEGKKNSMKWWSYFQETKVNDDASRMKRMSWIHLCHAYNSLLQGEQNIIKRLERLSKDKINNNINNNINEEKCLTQVIRKSPKWARVQIMKLHILRT